MRISETTAEKMLIPYIRKRWQINLIFFAD